MPSLDTNLHLFMLRHPRSILRKLLFGGIYGLEWGDPDRRADLREVKERFLVPYVTPKTTVLEIGPGGGRWTRYMLNAERLYAVDYHPELLEELRKNFDQENFVFIRNNGSDFPEVPDEAIDFLFSFGVFVHLDLDIIDAYLANMGRVLHHDSTVVIQYSDKNKKSAQENKGFSENRPEIMLPLIEKHGFEILEDERDLIHHSSVVRFAPKKNWSATG